MYLFLYVPQIVFARDCSYYYIAVIELLPRYTGVVGYYRIMSGKPLLLPELFSGEPQNWTEWLEHFESVAAVNKWESDEDKLKWLRVRLAAKAQTAVRKMPESVRNNYGECVQALKQRFDPDSKRDLYIAELHTRARHRGEDWASYGDALRTLADKAYGDLEEKARERLALTQYLSHIDNPQVALGVRQKRPETVQAAVVATIEFESYLGSIHGARTGAGSGSSTQREGATPTVSVVSPATESEPLSEALQMLNERLERLEVQMVSAHSDSRTRKPQDDGSHGRKATAALTCWNCGKKGHIARRCWSRQSPNGRRQGNSNPSSAWVNRAREDI